MKKNILTLFAFIAMVWSCQEIFEIDISDRDIVLLNPDRGDTIISNPMTFSWELDEDISLYHIQIAQPNFASAQVIPVDSFLPGTSLTIALDGGPYEWRVRGENGEIYSPYIKRSFYVDSTNSGFGGNISGLTITVLGPQGGDTVEVDPMSFAWEEEISVSQYRLQVARPSFAALQSIVVDTIVSREYVSTSLLPGQYEWRIRGENGQNYSKYITSAFYMDTVTNLNQPVLLNSPLNNQRFYARNDTNIIFNWERIVGIDEYRIQITEGSFEVPTNLKEYTVNGTSRSVLFRAQSYDKSFEWRVTGLSVNGNTETSARRSFTIAVPDTINFN